MKRECIFDERLDNLKRQTIEKTREKKSVFEKRLQNLKNQVKKRIEKRERRFQKRFSNPKGQLKKEIKRRESNFRERLRKVEDQGKKEIKIRERAFEERHNKLEGQVKQEYERSESISILGRTTFNLIIDGLLTRKYAQSTHKIPQMMTRCLLPESIYGNLPSKMVDISGSDKTFIFSSEGWMYRIYSSTSTLRTDQQFSILVVWVLGRCLSGSCHMYRWK